MSRRKKLPHGRKKATPRQPSTEAERDDALVADITRRFTCFTEIAHDFVHQCGSNLEDLECDLAYNRLAIDLWSGGPGRSAELIEVLNAFLALRERHHAALTALQPRLAELLDPPAHDHLETTQQQRDLIRNCVTPPPPVAT